MKKVAKKAPKGQSYAQLQRNNIGGGTGSVTGLVGDLVFTLLTPTQLAFVALWVGAILKFLVFYGTD